MKNIKKLCLSVLLAALVCITGISAMKAQAATGDAEDGGLYAVITTDRDSYEAGENITFTLRIDNNKKNWYAAKGNVTYNFTDGIKNALEGELDTAYTKISSGESYTLTGTLTGDTAIFPPSADGGNGGSENGTENPGDGNKEGLNPLAVILIAFGAIAVITFIAVLIVKKGKGGKSHKTTALVLAFALLAGLSGNAVGAFADDSETIVLRPYVNVMYGGQEILIRAVISLNMLQQRIKIATNDVLAAKTTTCHDPSIFKDTDGTYYVFGTHLGLSKSTDLFNWVNMDNEFRASFTEEEKEKIRAWNKDSGNWYGYLWAPDVIYNPVLEKYCMYLSANGDDWKSNIVMLTADKATGPYSYAGSVVYGGFCAEDYAETDAPRVLGEDKIPSRYVTYGVKNRKWGDKYPNCIDPCVFYDADGNLWMAYGSWSGGIFMLALDETTGLRDYSVSYDTNIHSDAYFGKLIAGGAYVSGEGSYIQKIGDYYYLFISYGNLEANGGYNIRIFRSPTPDGNYVDMLGNTPYYDTYVFNYNQSKGVRLFGGYKWRNYAYGLVAQGHNSAFVDDDGKAYIVYHTRTADGTEGHYVRVHQLFMTDDGWLLAAPYQTSGETLNTSGISAKEIAGDYEMIIHNLTINYKSLETNKPVFVTLNSDGTITGDETGSWKADEGTPYITVKLQNNTYRGVALKQKVDNTKIETVVFTVVGTDNNQITVWGSKVYQ